MIKIAKFGGSSVADAEHFKKIKAIVDADPARRFVVVSACGRRFKGDTKVTDLLYLVNAHVKYHVSCEELLEDIGQRYFDIADELELTYPIREEFAAFAERARSGGYSTEELVSRGEYFTAPDGRVPGPAVPGCRDGRCVPSRRYAQHEPHLRAGAGVRSAGRLCYARFLRRDA